MSARDSNCPPSGKSRLFTVADQSATCLRWGLPHEDGGAESVSLKRASHFWLSIQKFIFFREKSFSGFGWVGLGWGGWVPRVAIYPTPLPLLVAKQMTGASISFVRGSTSIGCSRHHNSVSAPLPTLAGYVSHQYTAL